jgi:hypothetical protein
MVTWSLPIGDGTVLLHEDGCPVQFRHPGNPDQLYLLDEENDRWHSAEHRWGTGFLITAGLVAGGTRRAWMASRADLRRSRE